MSAAGGSSGSPQTTVSTSCCESGRPIMTDPTTGQTVCSCQYSSSALLSYPRVAGLTAETVYGSAYAAQGYVPFGSDPSAFYSPLVSHLCLYFCIIYRGQVKSKCLVCEMLCTDSIKLVIKWVRKCCMYCCIVARVPESQGDDGVKCLVTTPGPMWQSYN